MTDIAATETSMVLAHRGVISAAHMHEAAYARYASDPSEEAANELEAATRQLHQAARIYAKTVACPAESDQAQTSPTESDL